MKLFKPLLTVLALAFALIFITACSSGGNAGSSSGKTTAKARTIDEIKKSGELRIAVFGDKKPFGYVDNDGSYQGYDIELGNQLAKDLGVKVKYISVDAANRAEYLISNKVDITLANFTVTDERRKTSSTRPMKKHFTQPTVTLLKQMTWLLKVEKLISH